MDIPTTREKPAIDGHRLPPIKACWAFFLDVDGTLLEFAEKPDQVAVRDDLRDLLRQLQRAADGAIALISGRTIENLDRLFSPLKLPLAGEHGFERRDFQGRVHHHHRPNDVLVPLRRRLNAFIADHPEVILEDKKSSFAIHYRQAPDQGAAIKAILDECLKGPETDFQVLAGKMVFEVRPGGRDKGMAIEEFMQEPPFRGRLPVFIGDDTTDEDGFMMINHMNGHSIKVGSGASSAAWRLPDTGAVMALLREYIDFINGQHT